MPSKIYITGHKNPDSDSICSAIAYADLKCQLGYNAVACRLGKINRETQFILNRYHLPQPELITSAKAALKDIAIDPAITVKPNDTVRKVWDLCLEHKTNTIFVVDEKEQMIGLTTMSDISKIQMQDLNLTASLLKDTPLENLVLSLKGGFIYKGTLPRSGYVRIVDKKIMERDITGNIMVVSDSEQDMITCMYKGCSVLAIAEDYIPGQIVQDMAKEKGVTLITTHYNIMKILQMIYRSIPAGIVMTPSDNLVRFNGNEYVEDISRRMLQTRYRKYPVYMNDKLIGAVARFHLLSYEKKQLILLDHNEKSQSIDDIEYGTIQEIIDHHRIGDVETSQPIIFRNVNVGSTATIIATLFKENGKKMSDAIAGCVCCAIISDTMNFNSPTCTQSDKDIAKEIAAAHHIDLKQLAKEMFESSANLNGMAVKDILKNDFKEYELNGYHLGIGQINLFDLKSVDPIEEEVMKMLEVENESARYDLLMMVFSNVEGKGSRFIFTGKLAQEINPSFKTKDNELFIKDIVSRKKQIVPMLAALLR